MRSVPVFADVEIRDGIGWCLVTGCESRARVAAWKIRDDGSRQRWRLCDDHARQWITPGTLARHGIR